MSSKSNSLWVSSKFYHFQGICLRMEVYIPVVFRECFQSRPPVLYTQLETRSARVNYVSAEAVPGHVRPHLRLPGTHPVAESVRVIAVDEYVVLDYIILPAWTNIPLPVRTNTLPCTRQLLVQLSRYTPDVRPGTSTMFPSASTLQPGTSSTRL